MEANKCTVFIEDFIANSKEHFEDFLDNLAIIDYELAKVFALAYFHPVENGQIIHCSVKNFKKKCVPLFKRYLTSWEIKVYGYCKQTFTN